MCASSVINIHHHHPLNNQTFLIRHKIFRRNSNKKNIIEALRRWLWHNSTGGADDDDDRKYLKIAKISTCRFLVVAFGFTVFVFQWNFTMTVFLVHAPKRNNVQKNYSKIHLQRVARHSHTHASISREEFSRKVLKNTDFDSRSTAMDGDERFSFPFFFLFLGIQIKWQIFTNGKLFSPNFPIALFSLLARRHEMEIFSMSLKETLFFFFAFT